VTIAQLSPFAKLHHQKAMHRHTERELANSGPSGDLRHVEVIFAESRLALEQAWRSGCPRTAEVRTASPALLDDPSLKASPLDAAGSGDILRSLGRSCHGLAQALHQELRDDRELSEFALTVVRAIPAFQRILFKAMGLRAEDFVRPVATIDHQFSTPLSDARFNGPMSRLLGANPARASLRVEAEDVPAVWTHRPGLLARMRFEPVASIAYRLLINLLKRLPLSLSRTVLIYSENSLVKETATCLALRGYTLRVLSRPPSRRISLVPAQEERLRALISGRLRRWLQPLVTPAVIETLVEWFAELAIERAERYLGALDGWPHQLDRSAGAQPMAVLAGDLPTPETEALYRCCRDLRVPLYCFQHGTAIELSDATRHADYMDEICAADVYFAFNSVVGQRLTENAFAVGRAVSVGLPQDLCDVSRSKPGFRHAPPIYYVSCQLFMGNWQYPASIGLSDHENAEFEKALVAEVLARLPHQVLFKPYPSIRYLDPHPVVEFARTSQNVEIYEGWLDLRYLINGARVLIASHGGSTVSWCLLSGKPLVFIDCPDQVPLRPEVQKAFEAAVFVFDAGDPDFHARMLEFLSQPLDRIEELWRGKAAARQALIARWFGDADGHAGRRAADWIVRAARS
jgi:hypothetical protein